MSRRDPALEFDAIHIEGGLLPAEWLANIAALKAAHQLQQSTFATTAGAGYGQKFTFGNILPPQPSDKRTERSWSQWFVIKAGRGIEMPAVIAADGPFMSMP